MFIRTPGRTDGSLHLVARLHIDLCRVLSARCRRSLAR
jgi:hypothetical protein